MTKARTEGAKLRAIDATKGVRKTRKAVEREPVHPCRAERVAELSPTHSWHVARVAPQAEFDVIDRLDRVGWFGWTPIRETFVQRKAGTRTDRHVQRYPQLPGYVILAAPERPRWSEVWDCEGLHEVMSWTASDGSARPIPLGPLHIQDLMKMCDGAKLIQRFMRAAAKFDVGDEVAIVGGPFEGVRSVVKSFEDDSRMIEARVILTMTLFNALHEVPVPISVVRPVPGCAAKPDGLSLR